MRSAIRVEWWKLRSSRVVMVATVLMALLVPAMGLGIYQVALSGGAGILADKATIFLVDDGWLGFLRLVDQVVAVAVFLGAGIVVAWVFGREHVDRTFPSLFSLPVPRATIAAAKFVVLVSWAVGLSILIVAMSVTMGMFGGLAVTDADWTVSELVRLGLVSIGACLLAVSVAFVASIGRGYLAAIGALIVIVAVTQVAVLFGTGAWFPYAVPGLMAVAGTDGVPLPTAVQIALVPVVLLAAVGATLAWWRRAEVA